MMRKILLMTSAILSFTICESALAELRTGSDCDGNCTYYYDTSTGDFRIEKNENATSGDIVIRNNYDYHNFGYIKNMTIGEGITRIESMSGYVGYAGESGKLVLPESLQYVGHQAFLWNNFSSIEFKSANFSISGEYQFRPLSTINQTLIVPANKDYTFPVKAFSEGKGNLNIQCKGEKSTCEQMFEAVKTDRAKSGYDVSVGYYAGDDGNGHWEEWSDNGKAVYADSSKQRLLSSQGFDGSRAVYDLGGNVTAQYDKNGKLIYAKKIYTPAEAAAATKDGNNNTVSITW